MVKEDPNKIDYVQLQYDHIMDLIDIQNNLINDYGIIKRMIDRNPQNGDDWRKALDQTNQLFWEYDVQIDKEIEEFNRLRRR